LVAGFGGLIGWMLAKLVRYDELVPGVLRRLLDSGPGRRQAVFALIASELAFERHEQCLGLEPSAEQLLERANVLFFGNARDILTLMLGREPPEGLKGALERIGQSAFKDPRNYGRLISVFADPDRQSAAAVLRYVDVITPQVISAIEVLPPHLLHQNVLKRIARHPEPVEMCIAFARTMEWVQSVNSAATECEIRSAISKLGAAMPLDQITSRLLRRANKALAAPIADDQELVTCRTVQSLIMVSRRFRNCLGMTANIANALEGRTAYAIFRDAYVVEFNRLNDGSWLFADVHAARNGYVERDIFDAVTAKCAAASVAFVPKMPGIRERYGRFLSSDRGHFAFAA